jgi:hypothetical protein
MNNHKVYEIVAEYFVSIPDISFRPEGKVIAIIEQGKPTTYWGKLSHKNFYEETIINENFDFVKDTVISALRRFDKETYSENKNYLIF